MITLRHKIWHDIRQNTSRTLLIVLSIAAGVFAIGTIFGLVDQLLSNMDQAHQDVAPSHISIILRDPVDQPTAESLTQLDGVAGIEPINQLSVRYKNSEGGDWELGTLFTRSDYMDQTYDLVTLKEGAWPSNGEIGIERLSTQYFDIDIGEQIFLEIDGAEELFTVNSRIRHPFVQPPSFGGQAHFFADSQGIERFGIPSGTYNQLLVQIEPYSGERARDVAGALRSELAALGYGVVVTLYQSPTEHWGRMFVEGINLVLQIMAIVALIMSVILVFNSMNALITQQTNQIGIIKATGGRIATIMVLYLSTVFIYGALSLLIALPLSAISAFALSGWFLNLFNIEVSSFQVSGLAIMLQVIAAIGVPLLAALWPVLRGASISVREAISTYGIGNDFGSGRLDALIERFGAKMLPASYAAALGNIFRRKGRLSLTLFVLVIAGTMFLIIMSLISSTNLTLDNEMARQDFDLRVGFSSDHDIQELLDLVDDAGIGQEAELWYSRNATMLRDGERLLDSAGLGAQLLGIPIDNAMYEPIITSGRWLAPNEANGIVISQETAEVNQIGVGDSVTLNLGELGDSQWEVVGAYRVVYGNGFNTEAIYASRDSVLEAVNQENRGTQLLVRTGLETLEENQRASDTLHDRLEQQGYRVDFYTTNIKLEQRAFADNQFGSVTSMLLSLAMLVAAVGGIGLMGSLGTSVVERTREIGVMRAVGAQSRTIMGLFVTEGIIQGLISWMLAIPLALILAKPLAQQLGQTMIDVDLDYAFNGPAVIIWLATILLIALLSSIIPARRAALISVRESLAYA